MVTASTASRNDGWLSLAAEAPLEASLPLIDAHHHAYSKLPSLPDAEPYDAERFASDVRASGHNVVATVYVETRTAFRQSGPTSFRCVGETEHANRIAERYRNGRPALAEAIVSSADLRSPDLRGILDAHIDAAPRRFRGIRQNFSWDEDAVIRFRHGDTEPGMACDPGIQAGVRLLGKLGLGCDVLIFHHQLADLEQLAKACPDTRLILNHLGCPLGVGSYGRDRAGVFARWQQATTSLAKYPNVYVKLGGTGMRIGGFGWHERVKPPTSVELAEATARYHLHAIDCFGPARCMFESNFPADRLSAPYSVVWNAFKRIVEAFSSDEKHQLFYRTASNAYNLGL